MEDAMRTALLVGGSVCSACSFVFSVTGALELSLILGPVSCCQSWWPHNALLAALWLPTLGLAAYLLHSGVQDAVPFVALGAIFLVVHLLLLLAYWLRATLRKQAAKELPTQELLTEAQRVMMAAANADAAQWSAAQQQQQQSNQQQQQQQQQGPGFQLQPGRTDGAAGWTLYIPGEQEEAVIQEVAARHFYQRRLQEQQQGQRESAGGAAALMSPQVTGGERGLKKSPSTASMRGSASPPDGKTAVAVNRTLEAMSTTSSRSGMLPPAQQQMGGNGAGGGMSGRGPIIQVLVPEVMSQRWNLGSAGGGGSGALRASQRLRYLQAVEGYGGASGLPSPGGMLGGGTSAAQTPKYPPAHMHSHLSQAVQQVQQQQQEQQQVLAGAAVATAGTGAGSAGTTQQQQQQAPGSPFSTGREQAQRAQEDSQQGAAAGVLSPARGSTSAPQQQQQVQQQGANSMVEAVNPLFSPEASLAQELSLRLSSANSGHANPGANPGSQGAHLGSAAGSFSLPADASSQVGSTGAQQQQQRPQAVAVPGGVHTPSASALASPNLPPPPAVSTPTAAAHESSSHQPTPQEEHARRPLLTRDGRGSHDLSGGIHQPVAAAGGKDNSNNKSSSTAVTRTPSPLAASHRRQGSTPPANLGGILSLAAPSFLGRSLHRGSHPHVYNASASSSLPSAAASHHQHSHVMSQGEGASAVASPQAVDVVAGTGPQQQPERQAGAGAQQRQHGSAVAARHHAASDADALLSTSRAGLLDDVVGGSSSDLQYHPQDLQHEGEASSAGGAGVAASGGSVTGAARRLLGGSLVTRLNSWRGGKDAGAAAGAAGSAGASGSTAAADGGSVRGGANAAVGQGDGRGSGGYEGLTTRGSPKHSRTRSWTPSLAQAGLTAALLAEQDSSSHLMGAGASGVEEHAVLEGQQQRAASRLGTPTKKGM